MVESAAVYLERNSPIQGITKLRIQVTKITEQIENKFIKIPFPVIGNNQDTKAPKTKYKDLKRLNHIFTVEGFIFAQQNQSASGKYYDANIIVKGATFSNPTYLTAAEAKNALIFYILYPAGDLNLYWRGLAKQDAAPGTAIGNLMEPIDTDRKNEVGFDKLQFIDAPGLRKELEYFVSNGFNFDEFGAEKYNFIMNLTRGELL